MEPADEARRAALRGRLAAGLGTEWMRQALGGDGRRRWRSSPGAARRAGQRIGVWRDVRIELPADQIGQRIVAVRNACQAAQFGDCALLAVEQTGGRDPSGSVSVRLAPDGIEPMVQLAGQHGDVAARSTRAEDLAQQIADTGLAQARLQKEHARLLELQQRRDLAVTDLLALSKRLAEIEAEAQQTQQDAAQQQRRVRTQLLTLNFRSTGGEQGRGEIAEAGAEFGQVFASSVAFVIRAVAALLPVVVVAVIAGWLLLQAWRWRARRLRIAR